MVQLAWESFDIRGRKIDAKSYVIRPDGFKIPTDAEKVHGISTAIAKRIGLPVSDVLDEFMHVLDESSVLVAHNLSFDTGILGAEFYRIGTRRPFRHVTNVCTMKEATDYCALPGPYGPKWPKLEELHRKLFRKRVNETHDAGVDTATCAKCFFELKRLGVIRIAKRVPR
jgi:DNA polymerase III epsilon subunit-like protein